MGLRDSPKKTRLVPIRRARGAQPEASQPKRDTPSREEDEEEAPSRKREPRALGLGGAKRERKMRRRA